MTFLHFISSQLPKLSVWNRELRKRFGPNIYFILSAASFLLVFTGLFMGIFLRDWGLTWIFVTLGLLLIIIPVINIFSSLPADEIPPATDFKKNDPDHERKRKVQEKRDEEVKRDIALEAALARQRIARREAERIRIKQEAEELSRLEELRKAQESWEREKEKRKKQLTREEKQRRQEASFNPNYFKQAPPIIKKTPLHSPSEFFSGITNARELKKRYLALIKIYHPDNSTGDIEITRRIQSEYRELSVFFEAYERHNSHK